PPPLRRPLGVDHPEPSLAPPGRFDHHLPAVTPPFHRHHMPHLVRRLQIHHGDMPRVQPVQFGQPAGLKVTTQPLRQRRRPPRQHRVIPRHRGRAHPGQYPPDRHHTVQHIPLGQGIHRRPYHRRRHPHQPARHPRHRTQHPHPRPLHPPPPRRRPRTRQRPTRPTRRTT